MPVRFKLSAPSPAGAWRLARIALIAAFIVLIGRTWHPYFGFTGLLQADPVTQSLLPASLQDTPIYIHREIGRYDGAYYAQIATSPALRDPALAGAVDDLGYRARRILLSAVAWAAGGGDPVRAVQAYAWLNVILWFVLAGLAWRLLPIDQGWRSAVAWTGLLLASGTLASVRLALTDLAATTLLATALYLAERGRSAVSAALLGLGGLARETAVLGLGALLPENPSESREWWRRGGLFLLAVLPLAAWWWYVWSAVGPSTAGSANLSWPLGGWIARWHELVLLTRQEPNHWLLWAGWVEGLALLAQMAYLLIRPEWRNPWWRAGCCFALLGLFLGPAVLEGLPGAAARVLLPLTLVFNVLAVRRRAALLWLLLGNLSVFGGIIVLFTPPAEPHLLPAHVARGQSGVVETDSRWHVAEWNRKWRWSWCEGTGGLNFRIWPWPERARVELQVRGITPRELEVWHNQARVWHGPIGDRPQWISLPELPVERGNLRLELRSPGPPAGEGVDNTARTISFACYGARVAE